MRLKNEEARASWFLAALMAMRGGPGAAEERGIAGIATARAEQVREFRARGENPGVGTYGLEMAHLVASGHVEAGPGWKSPDTATFSGQDDVWSLEDFVNNDAAQLNAYAFYLDGAFEHMSIQKPEIRVEIADKVYDIQGVLRLAPYAKAHEMVDLVITGDPAVLDRAAQRTGYRNGTELAISVMDRGPDSPSLSA